LAKAQGSSADSQRAVESAMHDVQAAQELRDHLDAAVADGRVRLRACAQLVARERAHVALAAARAAQAVLRAREAVAAARLARMAATMR
jgi:hypothetical protein